MRKNPLKTWRQGQGLTQREAAARLGVTRACWQFWETGQRVPDWAHRRKLRAVTGVNADQIDGAAVA